MLPAHACFLPRIVVAALALALALGALGCAGASQAGRPASAQNVQGTQSEQGATIHDPARLPTSESEPRHWHAQLDREHVLVGRIWHVAQRKFISEAELRAQLQQAAVIAIGERHDHVDHHRLQTELLQAVIAAGRKPALVFEMLEQSQQAAVDVSRAQHPGDVDALGRAVAWERSGWPAWAMYRPLFAAALTHALPILAAGLDRSAAMSLARTGTSPLDPQWVRVFGLAEPLPEAQRALVRKEMHDAHCGLLPERMLDSMVLVQRTRDALLAQRAQQGVQLSAAAVVITGNGHARRDRGMPALLETAFATPSLSVGLLEVHAARTQPQAYAEAFGVTEPPFDYLWFTPRLSDEDPCAKLRESMGKHSAEPGGG